MTGFALDDLRKIMRACAGVDESVDLDGNIGEVTFEDLGYDSLAVLEIAAKIQNELGIAIPDDAVGYLLTPQAVIEYVNVWIAA
jgi:minimal PKS acyl carrier protein